MTSNYPAILFCTVLDITHSPEKHDSLPMLQPRLGSDNVEFVLGVFERFSIGPSHHLTESHHVKDNILFLCLGLNTETVFSSNAGMTKGERKPSEERDSGMDVEGERAQWRAVDGEARGKQRESSGRWKGDKCMAGGSPK